MNRLSIRKSAYFWIPLAAIMLPAAWYCYLYVVRPLVFVVSFFALLAVTPQVTKQLERLRSPDGRVDAIVIEKVPKWSLDADSYSVYLARHGSNQLGNAVVRGYGKFDFSVTWLASDLLQVSYSDTCISAFASQWSSMEVENGAFDVEIRLRPAQGPARHPCP